MMFTKAPNLVIESESRPKRHSTGFTLVELLVVMTVMVSLGGMLTYALASATHGARIQRTQADVLSIGQILQSRVNEVSLTPVSVVYGRSGLELFRGGFINLSPISGPGTGGLTTNQRIISFVAQERSRLVLQARRDLARMTLPECQADLLYPPASLQFRTFYQDPGQSGWLPNVAQIKPPAQWNRMRTLAGLFSAAEIDAEYTRIGARNTINGATNPATNPEWDAITEAGVPAFAEILRQDAKAPWTPPAPRPQMRWTRQHESAECLYLILATTELFGQTAIDLIPSSQIKDTDNDGIPEILDSWERPYEFIRNPIGYSNPAIKNYVPSGSTPEEIYPIDPDPFDFLAADFRYDTSTHTAPTPESAYFPIFLPPMVASAGPDGEFGMRLSYVNLDADPEPEIGVNEQYSSSAVQYPARSYGPAYYGVRVIRCPDPFFNINTVASDVSAPYEFTIDSIVGAKRGPDPTTTDGGLGKVLDRALFADNITSLDADF